MTTDLAMRFWSKVRRGLADECWPWLAARTGDGYGSFTIRHRAVLAHRVGYELERGPIPAGLTLDHLCRNRGCVNPAHLEPVTMRENLLRGTGPTAQNAAKTACPHGHPYDESNTHIAPDGKRVCRECVNLRNHKRSRALAALRGDSQRCERAEPERAPYLHMVHRCRNCGRYLRRSEASPTGFRHSGFRP